MRNAVVDFIAAFSPDEPREAAARAIIGSGAFAVLADPRGKRTRHADIERPAIAIGHDVDPAAEWFALHN